MATKPAAKSTPKKPVPGKALTRPALIAEITERVNDLTKSKADEILTAIGEIAEQQLRKNGAFILPKVARFKVAAKAARPAREGRNPAKPGEVVQIAAKPATKVVRVKPSSELRAIYAS